ncbi:acyl carrier protein [Azospirillum brasilense]|uniref:Acyl carrier protein n=4 Tax=Azospirillum TaxID=191 RepID=A0A235H7Y3_AZOBR|nr:MULTISPECIES: phosphopantetheine-binding protein [Azospirillum]AIB12461.1 acyl carrier protein [Azospirillum argentinense]ALJ35934.1 acyl carrier protein [Azospirillum brasilense]AWJ90532.1 acyl carrier protein [Azospirillum baldaniorum]EZQ09276.1 acyl carrier protein [Azospirillum argentinense]KAA1056395.1 Acyl carrier protein (ACP1) [Azospirillum argentinense]
MEKLERELKTLIVDALKLEDIAPEEIDSEEPLFNDGLGLDSIDALELGVALRKAYGIKIESVTDDVKQHFANVRSLARFIQSQRAE